MTQDARFEDGESGPLNLIGVSAEDVTVISALLQDAVLESRDIVWERRRRRFALLLNRFRWEDPVAQRTPERVRSVLQIEDALAVRSQGIVPGQADTVLSLLTVTFAPTEDGAGTLHLTFAGDGDIAVEVEAVNLTLKDVTRPYRAPSGTVPQHEV